MKINYDKICLFNLHFYWFEIIMYVYIAKKVTRQSKQNKKLSLSKFCIFSKFKEARIHESSKYWFLLV